MISHSETKLYPFGSTYAKIQPSLFELSSSSFIFSLSIGEGIFAGPAIYLPPGFSVGGAFDMREVPPKLLLGF